MIPGSIQWLRVCYLSMDSTPTELEEEAHLISRSFDSAIRLMMIAEEIREEELITIELS